jgi:hypothetical protein
MKKSIFTIAVILALVVAVLLLFFPMQSAAADRPGQVYVATTVRRPLPTSPQRRTKPTLAQTTLGS